MEVNNIMIYYRMPNMTVKCNISYIWIYTFFSSCVSFAFQVTNLRKSLKQFTHILLCKLACENIITIVVYRDKVYSHMLQIICLLWYRSKISVENHDQNVVDILLFYMLSLLLSSNILCIEDFRWCTYNKAYVEKNLPFVIVEDKSPEVV